ncbi:MAG TPA: DUF4214 domain-containing protein [Acidimicrobiales bacterium]|nr:DUF4214 domain-containing protein [Acidimicrobiales bacterium]
MDRPGAKRAVAALLLAMTAAAVVAAPVTGAPAVPPGEPRVELPPPPPPPREAFVDTAVPDLLGRPPTGEERARWVAELGAGRTRAHLAHALARRPEHTRRVVADLYRRALGRGPDPAGLAFWAARLAAGAPVSRLAAEVYGSAEAYQRSGGTPPAYVEATYEALLGRSAEPAGLAHWSARLAAGTPRTTLARALYLTVESNRLRVVLAYIALLRRPPSDADRVYWGDRLRTVDDITFAGRLVASDEYLAWARRPEGTPAKVAAGASASISGDGRFVAYVAYPQGGIRVLDRRTGRTRIVTRETEIWAPIISADGTVIVFASAAGGVVPGDTNGRSDVFVAHLDGGAIRRLTDGDGDSTEPTVSGDGRVVAFTSTATDLVPGGTDGAAEVYVATLDGTGATTSLERVGGDGPSREPALSADGSTLVFTSEATDLVAGDDNEEADAFWARLPLAGADVARVSEVGGMKPYDNAFGGPSVSADGSAVAYLELSGDDPGPHVARVEGGTVTDRRGLAPQTLGTALRVLLSDDGQAVLTGVNINSAGRLTDVGLHYPTVDEAAPTIVGPYGDMSADGSLAVTGSGRRYPFWGIWVYLHDLG